MFKNFIKSIPGVKKVKQLWLHSLRSPYTNQLKKHITSDATIISNNCFGGRVPQDLGYQYNSPTAGLFFCYPDYIIFLKNLKTLINQPITIGGGKSKYPEINQYLSSLPYHVPVGTLSDGNHEVEIIFLHYHTDEEAIDKWQRRCRRFNPDNLIIFGSDNDRCSKKDVEDFMNLPYENKFFFSAHDYGIDNGPEYCFVKEMASKGAINGYDKAHILYRYLTKLKFN